MNPTEKSDRLSLRDWIGLGAIVGGVYASTITITEVVP